jgi:hypothetical protein
MLTNLNHKIRSTICSIKKLWRWIPIIWDDRDWDYWYILEILKQKLIDTEVRIRDNSNHVNSDIDASKIRTAIRLIERVQEDYYIQEYYDTVADQFSMTEVKKAISKQAKAQRILFKFLDYNIQNWWD